MDEALSPELWVPSCCYDVTKMFGWILRWWKEKRHEPSAVSNGSEAQQNSYEHAPSVLGPDKPQTTEAEYREHDRQYKDRQTSTNRLLVLFTFFTAAVGLWQGWMTRKALHDSEESSRIATDQTWRAIRNIHWLAQTMNNSLVESKIARETSEKQSRDALNASIEQMRLDQRAWVGVESIETNGAIVEGSSMNFVVKVNNTGKTPARMLAMKKQGFGSDQTTPLHSTKKAALVYSLVSPAGEESLYLSSAQQISLSMIDLFNKGTLRVFIRGIFDYTDIFGRIRHTSFCAYYPTERPPNLFNCQRGNSMD